MTMRRAWLITAWALVAVGGTLMIGGYIYGLLATDMDSIVRGLVVEAVGIGILVPGLHGVIDP